MSEFEPQALAPVPATAGAGAPSYIKRRRRYSLLNRRDKLLLTLMVAIPLAIFVVLIWAMTLVSVVLSFTDWQGVGPINFVGLKEYNYLFTSYPYFWPAVSHNVLWLVFFVCFATPVGILLAVCLDRPLRGSSVYQSIFFIPVVLSLAVVGFIWTLQYAPKWCFFPALKMKTTMVSILKHLPADGRMSIWQRNCFGFGVVGSKR